MKRIEGKRCLSILLVLVMVLGLLPTRLFTITARAADDVSYDSEASHFGFELKAGADKASGTDDDYLSVSRYTGSATAVEIPNTVTVSTLVSMGVLSSEQVAAYSVTELPVKEVGARFSSYSTSGITHIRLNASIEVIGYIAFAYMDALVDVDLSSDSKLTTINQYAFRDDGELTRVGMTESSTKTDKLPATLNSIGSYAFYHTGKLNSIDLSATQVTDLPDCTFTESGIASAKLPDTLTSTGWNVFKSCQNLTSLTFPAGITYFGPYSLEGCTSLTELVLKCGASGIGENTGGSYAALRGVSESCTVWVPRPADKTSYEATVKQVYGQMGASASVKLRWLNPSGFSKLNISPQTTPSAANSSVVQLKDSSGNVVGTFTYDHNDSNGDGLGGIITISGRISDQKLVINPGAASSENLVAWNVSRAYEQRRGTDVSGYGVLRGDELVEAMGRTQSLGNPTENKTECALGLTNSQEYGIYFYYPTLVNRNTGYTSGGRPQSARALPPVMVIYQPTDDLTGVQLSSGAVSNVSIDSGKYSCYLTSGRQVLVPGFDALMPYDQDFVAGVTETKNGGASITYQWYKTDTKTNSGGTPVGSGTAVFSAFDRAGGDGIYWRCGGLSEAYIENLAASGAGSHYFYLQVTVNTGSASSTYTSDPYVLNLYKQMSVSLVCDANEAASASNITNTGTNQYTILKNTTNVLFNPVVTNLPENFDGYVTYQWSGTNLSRTYTTNYLLTDWLDYTKTGTQTVTCRVCLYSAEGVLLTSASSPVKFNVSSTDATTYSEQPVFDVEKQSLPQYVDCDDSKYATDISVYLTDNMFGLTSGGRYTYSGCKYPTRFQVYKVDSADADRGGTLLFEARATNNGEFEVLDNTVSGRYKFKGTFMLDPGDDISFDDYGVQYYYIKAYNLTNAGCTGVAYSPTFPVIPTRSWVSAETPAPQRSVTVTSKPYETMWIENRTGTETTVTIGLELKNVPLVEGLYLQVPNDAYDVVAWRYKDTEGRYQYWSPSGWSSDDLTCEYLVDSFTSDGGDYTINGRVVLTIKDAAAFFGEEDMRQADGTVRLQLRIDPNALYTGDELAIEDMTTVDLTLVPVASGSLPTIISGGDGESGGREYLKWNSSASAYEFVAASDYTVIPENEYWLYSDRYDGKTAENFGNKPGSTEGVTLWATAYPLSNVTAWQVELPDGTKQILAAGQELVYDSGDASSDGTWPAYANKITVAYDESTTAKTNLTIALPTGDKAFVLKVTPIAVVLTDSASSAADTANWSAAKADQTYTIRINPVISATAPSVYGSGTYYFNLANYDLYTITASVYPADEGVVTCQWYYRSNSDHQEPETDTPVGPAIIVTEDTQVELELTEDILKRFAADSGSGTYTGTGCFYLYANNFNAAATATKNAQSTSGFYKVNVGSYLVTERPEIKVQADSFEDTVYYYEPVHNDGLYSVTVKAPTADMEQTVRMEYTIYAPNSSRVISSSYSNIGTATADSDGSITTSPYDAARYSVTDNGNGTVTYTITNKKAGAYPLGSQVNDGGTYRTDFDVKLRWFVQNQLQVVDGNYATGGKTGTQRGNTYTIRQRQVEQPGMSAVTLDENAAVAAGYTISDEAVAAGVGVSKGDSVPAFTQSSSGDGYFRPFTATLSLDEESRAGASLWLGLEYYDTTENAWKSANDRLYLPRSDGTYGNAGSVTLRKYDGEDSAVGYLMSPGTAAPALYDAYTYSDEDETYHYTYNDGDDALILRLTLTALYGDGDAYYDYYTASASGVVYSQPFALVRVAAGTEVDADKPVYQGSSDSFYDFTWNQDDSTVTSHSFGEDSWVIGESGTGAGVLSYQWQRYSKDAGGYVNITDNATATTPVLTAGKAEMAAWAADSDPASNGRYGVSLKLVVINTNNDPSITGRRTATESRGTTCYFGAAPATPAATATVNSASSAAATAGDADLTASVSVTGQGGDTLGTLDYQWECRVVSATPWGGTAIGNPDDAWRRDDSSATGSTYSIPTSNSDLYLWVPYDDGGTPGTRWYQVNGNSLWKDYQSVTVEYRCEVVNTEGTESVTGYSNTVTVTLNAPTFDLTVSGIDSEDGTTPPLRVTDTRTVTLSVTPQEGFSYEWVRYASYHSSLPDTVTDNAARLTITAADYSASYPYYVCKITHTASGITRETARVYVGRENADGSAMAPVVTTGSNGLLCDVGGATAESFSVTATAPDGGALSYQWQEYQDGTWTDLPGQKAASLELVGLDSAPCYRSFRCVVTNTKDESTAKDDSTRFYLTVRGVLLEDVTFAPVAGQPFATTLTATVYGLPGERIAWAISGSDFGYTLTAAEATVPTGSSVAAVTATLQSASPETATLNITATVGDTYEDPCSVTLNVTDFTIDTDKVTCGLRESMSETIAVTGIRPTSGWTMLGDIPAGLSISDSGVISGTPTIPGAYPVTLQAGTTEKACTIIVRSPAADKVSGDSGSLTIGDKVTVLRSDLTGTGWSWSSEAGVLTLDSSYPGGKIDFYSNNATPLYIRMKDNVTVEGTIHCSNSPAGLYLYGSGSLTVTSPAEEYNGIYLGPNGTLYDRRAAGDLTVTNSYTGSSNSHAVYGSIDGAGSAGTVTIQNTAYGSAEQSRGVYGNVTCTGIGAVSITATIADSGTAAYGVYGDLTQNGSGAVTIDVDSSANSANAANYSSYGVTGILTQNGTGPVTVTVDQNAGQAAGVYGAENVVLNSAGPVTITADGQDHAVYVGGTSNLTTGGSVSAEITGRNGTGNTVGADNITLGHTGGSVTLNAAGSADIVRAVYNAPTDATGYIVSGAPLSGTVTYEAAVNGSPIFTVGGVPLTPDASGNASYVLPLQQGETMAPLAVTAYCAGGCTLAYNDSGQPNGVTAKKEQNTITYSGTPGSSGTKTGSFTITATTTGETPQTATLTVNWTMSDLKLLSGPYLYRFDTTGKCQVRAGKTDQEIYFYAVGEQPAKLQVFDEETQLYEWTSADHVSIYSVDNGATWYSGSNTYCYTYPAFDASSMAVGTSKELTVKALAEDGSLLQPLNVTVTAVDPACPDYVTIGSGYGYYNLGLYDYEGAGWKWRKDYLQLNLSGYNGNEYSYIGSDGAPLKLFVQQSSSVSNIRAYAGLNITGNSGYKLTINNTETSRAALTLNSNALTVDTSGSVSITSAGKVLDGNSTVRLGNSVQMLRMEGTFANALTTDWLTTAPASYYLYDGTADATETPGVFLYGTGINVPDFAVTVDGGTSATVGDSVTLTAGLPGELTGTRKYNSEGVDQGPAFEITYKWESSADGSAWSVLSETTGTLTPDTSAAGSTQYRCTVTVNGTKSQTSDPLTLTVSLAGVTVSGTAVSWNGTDNAVYLLYDSSVSDADIKADMKLASPTLALAYAAVKGGITQNADGKRYDQTFSFSTVPAGTYKLAIYKPGKYVPKIITVIVDSSDVALGEVKLWLYGDVTYDGKVNGTDALQIKRYYASLSSVFTLGTAEDQADRLLAGNVTGPVANDTAVNGTDALQIKRYYASLPSVFDSIE